MALKLELNNKMHGSDYNAEILEYSLKADHHFDSPKNTRTVARDTNNASTKVAKYFSDYTEQFNSETHHLNSAMKYGFGILDDKKSTIAVYENGIKIKLSK